MKTTNHVVLQADQKGLEFAIDWPQADKVLGAMLKRLSEKGVPYNDAHVPQARLFLPKNLELRSREHAIFLFVLCFWMRGGVESDTAAKFLKAMYEQEPKAFIPESFFNWGPEATRQQIAMITDIMVRHRLQQRVEENAPGWVYNMRKLAAHWHGDPRELMNDKPDFETLANRIIGETGGGKKPFVNEDSPYGFMFFREKMTAMIAYFLMDSKLVPMFYAPVPVDFHVLRLLVTNRIILARKLGVEDPLPAKETIGINFLKDSVQALARQVTEGYCRKNKISPIALCEALWLLSRNLCRYNPGNSGYVANDRRKQATAAKKEAEEKLFETKLTLRQGHMELADIETPDAGDDDESGLTGRKRYLGLKRTTEELLKPGAIKSLHNSCGRCPVNDTCQFNISAGAYYVSGMLLPERLRFKPPNGQSHFLDHDAFKTVKPRVAPTVRFAKIHME